MSKARIWGYSEEEKEKGVIAIMCPGCKSLHHIYTKTPTSGGAKWSFNNDYEKPTISPSLLITTGKCIAGNENWDDEGHSEFNTRCHSFIKDGKIQFLQDCTHELKGQTVDLPEIE